MKRSPMPTRRRWIAKRSKKGHAYQQEYLRAIPLVTMRSGGLCEIAADHECDTWSTGYPHHRRLRSQGGSNDAARNLLDVCASGHRWIHRILPRKEAERLDLIVPRDVREHPYNPPR